jgi:hypothetical protein
MRGLIMLLLLVVLALATGAEAASRKECREACEAEIDQCVSACGSYGALDNPWRRCRNAVVRRCKQEGLQVCTEARALGPACGDTAAPECNGTCSEGKVCSHRGPQCECLSPCTGAAAPECNGACPSGEVCAETQVEPFRSCSCVPTCVKSEAPVCGGDCPARERCALFEDDLCLCVRGDTGAVGQACSATFPPQCGGTCPAGLTCQEDPLGVTCGCQLGGFIGVTTTSTTTTTTVP